MELAFRCSVVRHATVDTFVIACDRRINCEIDARRQYDREELRGSRAYYGGDGGRGAFFRGVGTLGWAGVVGISWSFFLETFLRLCPSFLLRLVRVLGPGFSAPMPLMWCLSEGIFISSLLGMLSRRRGRITSLPSKRWGAIGSKWAELGFSNGFPGVEFFAVFELSVSGISGTSGRSESGGRIFDSSFFNDLVSFDRKRSWAVGWLPLSSSTSVSFSHYPRVI